MLVLALLVVMLAGCKNPEPAQVADPVPAETETVSESGTFESSEDSADTSENAAMSESNDDSDKANITPNKLYSTGDDFHQVRCWYIKGGREWGMSCLPYSQITNPRQ